MTNSDPDLWTNIETADAPAEPPSDPASEATAEPVPVTSAQPTDGDAARSKSQRIRDYLSDHPQARNRDVVDALSAYGVRAADVANVKTIDKKKADSQPTTDAKSPKIKAPKGSKKQSGSGPRAAKPAKPAAARDNTKPVATPAASSKTNGELVMSDLEAGLAFIAQAGGIEKAHQVLELIARIRSVNLS
jgi:hypothetical protein